MGYTRNNWETYDPNVPDIQQPDAFITKSKLDHIEKGIEQAVTDLVMGECKIGASASAGLDTSPNDKTIKVLNLTIPQANSWYHVSHEIVEGEAAPTGCIKGDFLIDTVSKVYKVDSSLKAEYLMTIKGEPGSKGNDGTSIQNITSTLGDDNKTITFTFIMDNGSVKQTSVTLPL